MRGTLGFLAAGTAFGFALSRSGAADYDFIQGMFLFTSFQLYGILCVGVGLGVPLLWLVKKRGKTFAGKPLQAKPKPRHLGNVVGGALFGIGWSITGMCPGPIFVNIGEGKVYALAALAGALVGAYLLGAVYVRLSRLLGLPAISRGASGHG